MNIVFTILSISTNNDMYIRSAKKLISEILAQTDYDVILSTNKPDAFSEISMSRTCIRNNISEDSMLNIGNEFNYNLKHFAFKDIPTSYDYIIYLDCDIKLSSWTKNSDEFMMSTMSKYNFGADRVNCYLKDEVRYYLNGKKCLFSHKIKNYNIVDRYTITSDIMNSRLPSEHFLIFKNEPDKIIKFQNKWEEQSIYLQNTNCTGCAWGDGFEIGIAARHAGYHNICSISTSVWKNTLGFHFNGNKNI